MGSLGLKSRVFGGEPDDMQVDAGERRRRLERFEAECRESSRRFSERLRAYTAPEQVRLATGFHPRDGVMPPGDHLALSHRGRGRR